VEIGIRPGEKLHEEMITKTDALNTIDLGRYYAILPSISYFHTKEKYLNHYNAFSVPCDFHYSSDENNCWEDINSLRKKIADYCNTIFYL
jgi:FlaA1/EpsC-like NDP-sugar epimerase